MASRNVLPTARLDQIKAELTSRSLLDFRVDADIVIDESIRQLDDQTLITSLLLNEKAVYGVDDRKDWYEFPDASTRQLSESVAAIFFDFDVVDVTGESATLKTTKFGARHKLCPSERFFEQPCGAFGTGFLVASDLLVTAGHNVRAGDLSFLRFVFGFRMLDATTSVTTIPQRDIHSVAEVVGRHEQADGSDWAIVKLRRSVDDRPVLNLRKDGRIEDGADLSVMGYPSGLPIKFADSANVRDNRPEAFFTCNLDVFGGNSGSPIFGSNGLVEGVLARGEADFISINGCFVTRGCPTTGCRGEDCTRVTEFAPLIPAVP
jgi:hypothetical protein